MGATIAFSVHLCAPLTEKHPSSYGGVFFQSYLRFAVLRRFLVAFFAVFLAALRAFFFAMVS